MRADDKDIVETLKACPENGFRMLMAKYQEAVYWHIRDWWYRTMMHRMPRKRHL